MHILCEIFKYSFDCFLLLCFHFLSWEQINNFLSYSIKRINCFYWRFLLGRYTLFFINLSWAIFFVWYLFKSEIIIIIIIWVKEFINIFIFNSFDLLLHSFTTSAFFSHFLNFLVTYNDSLFPSTYHIFHFRKLI